MNALNRLSGRIKYAVSVCCVALISPAMAQDVTPRELPSQQQIIDALTPPKGPRLRNFSLEPAPPVTLDLSVGFEINSARLDAKGRQALDALAAALKGPELVEHQFRIEGHTDSSGRAAANQQLSERRALEVVRYLVTHGVERTRLEAIGKGQTEPLIAENPRDPRNRRVRVALKDE
jgi:outer membrane protein OmpA-like peptidoglycan-associated protein